MGIQAPGVNEYLAAFLTALLNYNRPLILIAVFVLVFIATYLSLKKNLLISLIISVVVALTIAFYFVITYSSGINEISSTLIGTERKAFPNLNENVESILGVNSSEIKGEVSSVLNFPRDHGQHSNFAAEWWYLNLLVRTTKIDGTNEKDLGYIMSFSRIAGNNGLLSSEYDQSTKSFKERANTGGSLSVSLKGGKYLFAQYSNGSIISTLEELPPSFDRKRVYKLTGRTVEIGNFDLTLKERAVVSSGYNTPLLWGGTTGNCRGKISVFGNNDTFYYSIPDLDITGTITDGDGVKRNVKIGKAWIDHQWFNAIPPSDWKGHYWTSFHYTHSNDLYDPGPHQAIGFVTQIYKNGPRYIYWVKRNVNGTNECGDDGRITINSYGSTNYPSSWKVELNKSNNLFLAANGISFSDNQIFRSPPGPAFFEPASYYSGTVNGKLFTGLGFFETHLRR